MAHARSGDTLRDYESKRDFARTPEPRGERKKKTASSEEWSFVIQKHAARRLHYDFRLQLGGVLLSWAVPKGPSLDPKQKRLAMRTEDHPLEYADFEGIIPKGEYGAGAVIVWDRGRWIPDGDPEEALAKGNLKFTLIGSKLRGSWRLVRTRSTDSGREQWLLIKSRDEAASAERDVLEEEPESVLSGRTLEEVKRDPDRLWRSEEGFGANLEPDASTLRGAKRRRIGKVRWPEVIESEHVPEGDDWLHEIGHAGVRVMVRVSDDQVEITGDDGRDLAERAPHIARTLRALPLGEIAFLGVITKLSPRGIGALAPAERALERKNDEELVLMAFDLLELDRFDLGSVPLIERKRALFDRLQSAGAVGTRVRWVDHVIGRGDAVEEHAREIGARTIVSKQAGARAGSPLRLTHVGQPDEPLEVKLSPEAEKVLRSTRFTNPDRVLFPAQGITKIELATYYAAICDYMLPHLAGRILTMYRCPEGEASECFYQKHVRPGMPKSLRRVKIEESGEIGTYVVADDLHGLLGLVQIGVLEIHGWMSTDAALEQPDRMIFDLDPDPSVVWSEVTKAARELRDRLRDRGLESFVTTTGKKGLHVVVPLMPSADYDAVKSYAREVAQEMANDDPKRYVAVQTKAKRAGKIYVDYLRNGRGASAIIPYSTRAKPGAPIATPLAWDELDHIVGADAFVLRTLPARLAKVGDVWEGFFDVEQSLAT